MTVHAALPSDFTSDEISYILEILDLFLNSIMLQALTHGVTLWAIFRSSTKNSSIVRYVLVFAIFMLYILATIELYKIWASLHYAFIDQGQNCYMAFVGLDGHSPMIVHHQLTIGIVAGISVLIADSSLIWRCWTVWGHQ
ncbi:hypothetical protein IW261DRAFT_1423499 [Armillaria novae-zelandiae]|uniref:Uncharacterized protein n=1 Tax=Armillaria novae-zelandiae TaxID=153914 RepID=A0AA39U3J2_9AGAR|nr:hypothetical protein IW261DRAFT_1423499 [Armillaria novae-zelandiae]